MIMHWFRSITIKLCNHSKRKRTGLVLKRKMPVKTNIMVKVVGGSIQTKPRPYASLLLKYQQDSGWSLLQSQTDKTKMCAFGHRWRICGEILKWHKCWESPACFPGSTTTFWHHTECSKFPHCTAREQASGTRPLQTFTLSHVNTQSSPPQVFQPFFVSVNNQGDNVTPEHKRLSLHKILNRPLILSTQLQRVTHPTLFVLRVWMILQIMLLFFRRGVLLLCKGSDFHIVRKKWVKNIP